MLSNFDIEKLCDKLDLPLIGIYQKDLLEDAPVTIGSYYINQQNSTDGNGSHWTLIKIYCDEERDGEYNGMRVAKALYFDPFGLNMSKEVEEFLAPFKPIPYNNKQIQNVRSDSCGWYCIACDYILEHKMNDGTYLEDYEKFLAHFKDDPTKNLTLLKEIFKPL
jgi:hypothetical protein